MEGDLYFLFVILFFQQRLCIGVLIVEDGGSKAPMIPGKRVKLAAAVPHIDDLPVAISPDPAGVRRFGHAVFGHECMQARGIRHELTDVFIGSFYQEAVL